MVNTSSAFPLLPDPKAAAEKASEGKSSPQGIPPGGDFRKSFNQRGSGQGQSGSGGEEGNAKPPSLFDMSRTQGQKSGTSTGSGGSIGSHEDITASTPPSNAGGNTSRNQGFADQAPVVTPGGNTASGTPTYSAPPPPSSAGGNTSRNQGFADQAPVATPGGNTASGTPTYGAPPPPSSAGGNTSRNQGFADQAPAYGSRGNSNQNYSQPPANQTNTSTPRNTSNSFESQRSYQTTPGVENTSQDFRASQPPTTSESYNRSAENTNTSSHFESQKTNQSQPSPSSYTDYNKSSTPKQDTTTTSADKTSQPPQTHNEQTTESKKTADKNKTQEQSSVENLKEQTGEEALLNTMDETSSEGMLKGAFEELVAEGDGPLLPGTDLPEEQLGTTSTPLLGEEGDQPTTGTSVRGEVEGEIEAKGGIPERVEGVGKPQESEKAASRGAASAEAVAAAGAVGANTQPGEIQAAPVSEVSRPLPPKSIQELANQLINEIQIMEKDGNTHTTITLKNPPVLQGATVTLTTTSHASKEFNISFANLSPQAKAMLDMNLQDKSLSNAFESKGLTIHILTTTTQEERLLDTAGPGVKDRRDDQQQQQQGQQQRQKRQPPQGQQNEEEENG